MLISKSNSFYIIRQLKKFTLNLLEVEYLNFKNWQKYPIK